MPVWGLTFIFLTWYKWKTVVERNCPGPLSLNTWRPIPPKISSWIGLANVKHVSEALDLLRVTVLLNDSVEKISVDALDVIEVPFPLALKQLFPTKEAVETLKCCVGQLLHLPWMFSYRGEHGMGPGEPWQQPLLKSQIFLRQPLWKIKDAR